MTTQRIGFREIDRISFYGCPLQLWRECTTIHYILPILGFWATVCKTVRPMLSNRVVLSVLSVCLSVTLVYCGQTVG